MAAKPVCPPAAAPGQQVSRSTPWSPCWVLLGSLVHLRGWRWRERGRIAPQDREAGLPVRGEEDGLCCGRIPSTASIVFVARDDAQGESREIRGPGRWEARPG